MVTKRHGSGTYVSEGRPALPHREKIKILAGRADALLTEARHLVVVFPDIVKLLRDRNTALEREINK